MACLICEAFLTYIIQTPVFVSGRALLLRICNDLLRRLSKSQNTVFCGKIQIFLSRLFPLDEKSGLNLMGHFNTENLTPFNDSANEIDMSEEISIDLTDDNSIEDAEISNIMKVNKGFYKKFWILQDFFRNSIQCYDEAKLATFCSSVNEVLSFFSKFRVNLDSCCNESLKADWSSFSNADMTFTKYLTSEKLFDLQLMDPNFRRCVLVQLAVTFQYLLAPIKFKSPDQVLKEDQLKWVEKQQVELQKLLECLSSEREPFAAIVRLVLDRETLKSNWKNDGCPSFVKKRPAASSADGDSDNHSGYRRNKCRIIASQQSIDNSRPIVSFDTNAELTRLWNICPDNLAACRDSRRNYNPNLGEYFANARLELDPEEKVEERYRSINDERWCWASLRLLSRKSQHFYTNWQNPGQPVKQYLSTIILDKLGPADGTAASGGANSTIAASVGGVDSHENECATRMCDDDSCSPKTNSDSNVQIAGALGGDVEAASVIAHHLDELAQLIGDRWLRVGEALQFHGNDLSHLEMQNKTDAADRKVGNKMMLNLWLEGKSSMAPTLANLVSAFEEVGIEGVVAKIRAWSE